MISCFTEWNNSRIIRLLTRSFLLLEPCDSISDERIYYALCFRFSPLKGKNYVRRCRGRKERNVEGKNSARAAFKVFKLTCIARHNGRDDKLSRKNPGNSVTFRFLVFSGFLCSQRNVTDSHVAFVS